MDKKDMLVFIRSLARQPKTMLDKFREEEEDRVHQLKTKDPERDDFQSIIDMWSDSMDLIQAIPDNLRQAISRQLLAITDLFTWQKTLIDVAPVFKGTDIEEQLAVVLENKEDESLFKRIVDEHKQNVHHLLSGQWSLPELLEIQSKIEEVEQQILDIEIYLKSTNKKSLLEKKRDQKHRFEKERVRLNRELNKRLNSKEIVWAYEQHKIMSYAKQLDNWLVRTPSVREYIEWIESTLLKWKSILLSWPVWTWKTRWAYIAVQEIIKSKLKQKLITQEEYQELLALPMVNWNEETTIRDIQSKPVQANFSQDRKKAFEYLTWDLTKSLKYGIPMIIDEANRTPANFLSSLKKYFSLRAWEIYEDPMTGEKFPVRWPLQVIFTANEWSKYESDVNTFQDQIEREVDRQTGWYLPNYELYDIIKAKLYESSNTVQIVPWDLNITIPNLIKAQEEINNAYLLWKEFSDNDGTWTRNIRIKSAVLDTKRFLQLIPWDNIWSQETLRDEINAEIVKFINWLKYDEDKLILCEIFHTNWLLCTENIKQLTTATLSSQKLWTKIATSRSGVTIPSGDRLIDPRQLATADHYKQMGYIWENGEPVWFENLAFDSNDTKIFEQIKKLNELNTFNALDHPEIMEIITDILAKGWAHTEQQLKDLVRHIMSATTRNVDNTVDPIVGKIIKIFIKLQEIYSSIKFDQTRLSLGLVLSSLNGLEDSDHKKLAVEKIDSILSNERINITDKQAESIIWSLYELEQVELLSILSKISPFDKYYDLLLSIDSPPPSLGWKNILSWKKSPSPLPSSPEKLAIPQNIVDFRNWRKDWIKWIDATKSKIKATAEKMISDWHFYFEQEAWLKSHLSVFKLPWMNPVKIYDWHKEFEGMTGDDFIKIDYQQYWSRTPYERNEIKLQAMRWVDLKDREDWPVKTKYQELEKNHGLQMASKEKMDELFDRIKSYYKANNNWEEIWESAAIAMWMYLTWNYWWYWLSWYNNVVRQCLKSHGDLRCFSEGSDANNFAGSLFVK